ncbi:ABC transporter substrate-binding protein [Pseudorhodobacter turbinis]|uniref:ABC transporter substrate-binding protein n=1 Tax=Pseudorhodobacter turbinis TaxID=2500533 RepID=A0A4P8ECJ4_9RHOB|nr:ABC transporter substrate-binding protein [Pseudorhodobacter turbinis]QCO54419.1 ABC transporter substrate-binding protein [Pseudorhodobacter turbinis]
MTKHSKLLKGICLAVLLSGTAPAFAQDANAVTFVQAVEPQGLDPTVSSPVAAGQVTWQNVFEGLVAIDNGGHIVPQLATEWTVSEDGLSYTFTLREGVTFQNGVPFNAETAKFTLERIIGENSTNGQKANYTAISSIGAPDASTLVLTLSARRADLLYWLGYPAAVMVEPSSAENNGTEPVGTGPYKVSEWRKGDRVIMSTWDGYWGETPAMTTVTARFIGDAQAQAAALQSGQVDIVGDLGAPELFKQFADDNRFTTVAGSGEMEIVAGMNNAKPPFDDVRVRQALMMAVDRPSLIAAVSSGYGTPIGSHFSPANPFYEDLTELFPYDPEKAKALLAEAGHPNGFTFDFKVPTRPYAQRSAEILQAFFSQIGVTANIQSSDFPAAWIKDVFKDTNYDMTIIGHAEPLDIGIYSRDSYYFNYDSPELKAEAGVIAAAVNEDEREAGYRKAQEMLANDLPALFLFSYPKLGVWKAGIDGVWENGPVPANDMTDVRRAE